VRRLLVHVLLACACLSASIAASGCRSKPHERVTVAVSIFPLYDLVRRIAGSDADVILVLPPGTPTDRWKVTPDVSARVAGARLFVSVGLGVDPWMDAVVAQASASRGSLRARALKLGDRVPTITTDDGVINGYVWMDPQRARLMATAIVEDLARVDPSHAIVFGERASALDASLASLDKEIDARVASWRAHDVAGLPTSMAYFAERYGLHGASATERVPRVDLLGGGDPKVGTYEDLIRFDVAALEPLVH
jgi:zinc transport system substrate-binding protein